MTSASHIFLLCFPPQTFHLLTPSFSPFVMASSIFSKAALPTHNFLIARADPHYHQPSGIPASFCQHPFCALNSFPSTRHFAFVQYNNIIIKLPAFVLPVFFTTPPYHPTYSSLKNQQCSHKNISQTTQAPLPLPPPLNRAPLLCPQPLQLCNTFSSSRRT